MQELIGLLDKQIEDHREKIRSDAIEFYRDNCIYKNIQYSDIFGIILRKDSQDKIKSVGFPFPLVSFPLNFKGIPERISINVFLRGKPLRDYQKNELIEELKEKVEIEVHKINNLEEFREISKKLFYNYSTFNYFDPYSFIGDSFVGTYITENFSKYFGLKLNYFYSENYLNLDVLYNTKNYTNVIDDYDVSNIAVFSDLIDTHWNRTKHLVKNLAMKGIPSVICGRNIIAWPKEGKIDIYFLMIEDILLRNQNIEDYMVECLYPFLVPSKFKIHPIHLSYNNLIINPFGSESNKNLSTSLVFNIIKNYKKDYPRSNIVIISGFRNSYLHMSWRANLVGMLIENDIYDKIIFKNYGAFREIKTEIEKYRIAIGITADTSIAHLFNAIGLRNITFYNLSRCDKKSLQSLASDSPLGFCRYGFIQFPCLFNEKNKESEELIKSVIMMLKYFNRDMPTVNLDQELIKRFNDLLVKPSSENNGALVREYEKNLKKNEIEWINNIYDPTILTEYLKDDDQLLISNWKICPLIKLGEYNDKIS